MGHCTSSELPSTETNNKEENGGDNENSISESHHSDGYSRKFKNTRRSSASSWVSNRLHKRRKNKDISAAFNLLDHDIKSNLVNINIATEEELMTLQGINRQLAKSIVEYRNTIGGFRRVEDLALVSGIGAAMLQAIKNDITLRKYPSYSSSRTQSYDSLPSCESLKSHRSNHSVNGRSLRGSPIKKMNVNSCSIFELMNIKGMNQEMAANIVHYRNKHGRFKNIDELIKVKGINFRIITFLQAYLSCNDTDSQSSVINDSISLSSKNKVISPINRITCHRRSHSAPLNPEDTIIKLEDSNSRGETFDYQSHRFSSEFSADLFELLSLKSDRPMHKDVFDGTHNGQQAIRIGSWNMQRLTIEKINNPGVLEVFCRTILESGFSILALQEITHVDVLKKICGELNNGSLRRIREWNGPKGHWKWVICEQPLFVSIAVMEYAAFLYNDNHDIQLTNSSLLQFNQDNGKPSSALRKPFLAYFKVHDLEMVVVNIHLQAKKSKRNQIAEETEFEADDEFKETKRTATNCNSENRNKIDTLCLSPVVSALKNKLLNEKFVILLGNFDLSPEDSAFNVLKESCHSYVIPPDVPTDISYDSPKGRESLDNIWLSSHSQKLNTGVWGIVREGLSHMAIPRGWGWGGVVSDHCPIYCDLYTSTSYSEIEKTLTKTNVNRINLPNGN